MNYRIIIIFKKRERKNEEIDPALFMAIIKDDFVVNNGFNQYQYPVSEILNIEFEKIDSTQHEV